MERMNVNIYPEDFSPHELSFAEVEIMAHYVRPGWIIKHYKCSSQTVYRAIWEGRLRAVRTRDGAYLVDSRHLPNRIGR
jgi:hypothetical protein